MGDRCRSDKSNRLDIWVGQDCIDGFLIAFHQVEYPGWQARLQENFGEAQRYARIALRWFQDKGIAARNGWSRLPERDHGREVERCDACDHAERLPHGIHVDAGSGAVRELALKEMRDADRKLDDFQATLDITDAVRDGLAMLGGQKFSQRLHLLRDDVEKLHHDASAPLRILRGPCWLSRFRIRDGLSDFRSAC